MQDSTRKRKHAEREATRHQAVASLATNPQHLTDCREASRSRSLTLYPLTNCSIKEYLCGTHGWSATGAWTGDAQRKGRKLTGASHPARCPQCGDDPVDSRNRATAYDLASAFPAERSRLRNQFAQVVHLRGQSGASFNLMIGATRPKDSRFPDDELAFGCVTHAPSDERYSERMLIATRKGKKLVQRPNKQSTIELESSYQVSQAGALFTERADMMRAEQRSESERITIEQASKPLAYRSPDYTHARWRDTEASGQDRLAAAQRADNRAVLKMEHRSITPVPERSFWDYRQTGYPRAFALKIYTQQQ